MGCASSRVDLPKTDFLKKKTLGNTEIQVSALGLGCMGMSAFYVDQEISEGDATELLQKALDQGLNFIDTAWIYGTNEVLIGKVLKKLGREKFVIATKFPMAIVDQDLNMVPIEYTQENVEKYCQESLDRLQIDSIDLYYFHRVNSQIPIETQVHFLDNLFEQGKIKSYGLSEVSEDTIRRAHAVRPLAAIQEEYSLFTRHVETNGVLDACQELGITLVAYSPLGRGVLTATALDLAKNDYRGETGGDNKFNSKENGQLIQELKQFAESKQCSASQIALAWLLSHKPVIPIPGTKRPKYLLSNNQSSLVQLSEEDIKKLSDMFPPEKVKGERYPEAFQPSLIVTTPALQ